MRAKQFLHLLLLVACLSGPDLAIAMSGSMEAPTDYTQVAPIDPAKDGPIDMISLEDMDHLASQSDAPLILINFWATWCGPCLMELPSLVALRDSFSREELFMVGVPFDYDPNMLKEFLAAHSLNYSVYLADPKIMTDLGIAAIPKTLLLDREGAVVVDQDGLAEYEHLYRAVRQALDTLPHEDSAQ